MGKVCSFNRGVREGLNEVALSRDSGRGEEARSATLIRALQAEERPRGTHEEACLECSRNSKEARARGGRRERRESGGK